MTSSILALHASIGSRHNEQFPEGWLANSTNSWADDTSRRRSPWSPAASWAMLVIRARSSARWPSDRPAWVHGYVQLPRAARGCLEYLHNYKEACITDTGKGLTRGAPGCTGSHPTRPPSP